MRALLLARRRGVSGDLTWGFPSWEGSLEEGQTWIPFPAVWGLLHVWTRGKLPSAPLSSFVSRNSFYYCNHRKLRKRLNNYDLEKAKEEGEPWLEIIVGSGHHSKVRQNSKVRQRIRPKVEEYLRERRLEFFPVNKGALVITFEEYAGSEPCFGEYYCNKCDKRWRNGRSWVGKWQACYDCYEMKQLLKRCYPLKQRSTRKQQRYTPNIVARNQRPIPQHLEELCEKCIELGRPCPRAWWFHQSRAREKKFL